MKMRKILKKVVVVMMAFSMLALQNGGNAAWTVKAEQLTSLGILDSWENYGPNYYCDVKYVKEKDLYYVYLKENTEQNQKMVLSGIPDNMKVEFISCAYSRNELRQVIDEVTFNSSQFAGVQYSAIEVVDLASGKSEPRVKIGILQSNYDATSKKLVEKYGDKVYPVEASEDIAVPPAPFETPKQTVTPTVKIKSVKLAKKKITVKWKKISTASKYKIVITKSGGKTVLSKTTKKTNCSYKIKGKVAKKYTVKVKAYNKSTKKWGAWTKQVVKKK